MLNNWATTLNYDECVLEECATQLCTCSAAAHESVPWTRSRQQSTGGGRGRLSSHSVYQSHFHHICPQTFQFSLMITISVCLYHVRVAVLGALITCFHVIAMTAMGRSSSLDSKRHQDAKRSQAVSIRARTEPRGLQPQSPHSQHSWKARF